MILVTGGAGLVGKALIRQLLSAHEPVRAIYNHTPINGFTGLDTMQCNILDVAGLQEAMQGITEVYHCAAKVSFNPRHKRDLFKVNIEGTANLVNAALEAGVRKFVHVSSVAALGRIRNDELIDESMNWTEETSNSTYGQSKYLGEMEVWRGIAEGLQGVVVNPSIILGSGDWENGSSKIFKSVYDEFPWYTDGVTGFVDVEDVARAMIGLMESDISGERFILSAEDRSYGDVFRLIAKGFDKKPPHKKVTPFIAALVWRREALKSWFTGKDPLVTRETAKTAMATAHFDNSKLLKYLPGFSYTDLEESIIRICHEFEQARQAVQS